MAMLTSRAGSPAVLTAVVGGVLSAALFLLAYYAEWSAIRGDFNSLADDRFRASENMFRESARLLNFMDNVFLIAPPASSPEFTGYVRSLKRFFESDVSKSLKLHGMAWVPKVSSSQREDYQRAARATIDPNYQICQVDNAPDKAAGERRSDCFPCYLSLGNTHLIGQQGKDLSLDPEAWKAMQQARDSGEPVATPPIKMPESADGRLGYRVFQPLFVGGSLKTVEDRRKACTGFLCLDLDVGVLIDNVLKDVKPVGIDILVNDDASQVAVCRHSSRLQPAAVGENVSDAARELEATAPAEFFGRKLLLCCRSGDAFWAGRTIWQPWVLLVVGLGLTLAVAGYQLNRAMQTSMIEQVVSTRLAAIQAERATLEYAQSS
jgi:CHASE1-domain containing sensor protein